MRLFNKIKWGFTLAEVLITIGVIGVVAVMTVPNLITKCDQTVTLVRFKKAFSVIQQGIRMASEEYGDCEGWDYELPSEDFINKYFSPYLKLSKVSLPGNVYKYRDLKNVERTAYKPFLMPDGAIFSFQRVPAFQNKNFILLDINGTGKPNRLGRDVFALSFLGNKLTGYTQYTSMNTWHLNPNNSGTSGQCNRNAAGGVFGPGSYCSSVIIFNNWTIPSGYPWK